jgi:hypothetical protein
LRLAAGSGQDHQAYQEKSNSGQASHLSGCPDYLIHRREKRRTGAERTEARAGGVDRAGGSIAAAIETTITVRVTRAPIQQHVVSGIL